MHKEKCANTHVELKIFMSFPEAFLLLLSHLYSLLPGKFHLIPNSRDQLCFRGFFVLVCVL